MDDVHQAEGIQVPIPVQDEQVQEEHGSTRVEDPVHAQDTADAGVSEEPMQSQRESVNEAERSE
eukprot:2088984-Amphidinium_carterae.1